MRFLLIFVSFFILISFSSCKKKLTQFTLDYTSTATIPSTFGTLVPFSIGTPEIETNSTYEFESNDTKKDFVKHINLETLTVKITNPSGETFSFVNEIEIYIDSPNQPEILIANKTDIPSSVGNFLSLNVIETDLKEYIKDDTFSLRLKVTSDETIPQDVTVEIFTDFFVEAQLKRN